MYLKVSKVAHDLGVSGETVKRWIHEGKLKAIGGGYGRPFLIAEGDYQDFLEREGHCTKSKADEDIRRSLLEELSEISKMIDILKRRQVDITQLLKRL